MKVLIADDDIMMLKTMEFKLKQEEYDVIACGDGKQALDMIQEHKPDVIITDIMMPYITGLELVDKVRNDLKLEVPIIMLSGVGLEKTVLEAFELGADDFVDKPFSPSELIVRIRKLTRARR